MNAGYNTEQLSQVIGRSRRAVQLRAIKEAWPFIEEPNPKGGGFVKHFPYASLPIDIQTKITTSSLRHQKMADVMSHDALCNVTSPGANGNGCNGRHALGANGNGGNGFSSASGGKLLGLLAYTQGTDRDRELAHVKQEILAAYEAATTQRGAKKPAMSQGQFCRLYNSGALRSIAPDIRGKVKRISVPTLHRWKAGFQVKGLGGLIRKHEEVEKQGEIAQPKSRSLTGEQQDYIAKSIRRNPDVRPARIYEDLLLNFGSAPNFSTIWRYMERWKSENAQLHEYLRDPGAWRNKYQLALGDMAADVERFCQRWEMDSTPCDIICSDGKRYAGVGLIDVFSRKPIVLISDASKSSVIAAVLRRGFLDMGIPEVLIKDHGQDYDSKHIQAVCGAFDIETPWIPVETPEAKPFIERFWGTIATGLFEGLPGFCGHNIAQRQAIRNRRNPRGDFAGAFTTRGETVSVGLGRDELQEAIDKWIMYDYEQRPHRGIDNETPAARAAASNATVRKVGDERVLDILLAPSAERMVGKKGIQFENGSGFYRHPNMGMHVGSRVLVRPDLADASRIYVFHLLTHRYLFTARDKNLDGLTREQITTAKKVQRQKIKAAVQALDSLKQTVADSPLLNRLDSLQESGRAVVPLIRTEEFFNPAIESARLAVEDQISLVRPVTEETIREQVAQITSYQAPDLIDEAIFNAQLAGIAAGTSDCEARPPIQFPAGNARPQFDWPVDRYKWCVEMEARGKALSEDDRLFARRYEGEMDMPTAQYWQIMKATMACA